MLPGKKGIFLPGVNAHPGNLLIGVRSSIIRKKTYQLSILLIQMIQRERIILRTLWNITFLPIRRQMGMITKIHSGH